MFKWLVYIAQKIIIGKNRQIAGWTNPSSTETFQFEMKTVWTESAVDYDIDHVTGFEFSVVQGECNISLINVTDGDYRIWVEPKNYTFIMTCNHDVITDYGIRITFPEQFTLVDRARCIFSGYKSKYSCEVYAAERYLEVYSFLDTNIKALDEIKFTIDSIRNPPKEGRTDPIMVQTIDSGGSQVDVGYWTFEDDDWRPGNITTFTVEPQDDGIGQFPVKYTFHIVPCGEINQGSYFQIDLPPEIEITDPRALEDECGTDLQDFVEDEIFCKVSTDGRTLKIVGGFENSRTTNLTDDDFNDDPPQIYFTIDYFRNPRQNTPTSPWNITIYNETDDIQYSWNETSPTRPTTRVTGVAPPTFFNIKRETEMNGAISDWEFEIEPTNYMDTGDSIYITLPYTMSFSEDTQCLGTSNNLNNVQQCKVSVNLSKLLMEVKLSDYAEREGRRRRFLQYTGRIEPGQTFSFLVTGVKNAYSFRPSESLLYQVFNSDNILFEEQSEGIEVVNTLAGGLSQFKNGLTPASFESDIFTNYTLEIAPINYEKNMNIIVYLPPPPVNATGNITNDMINLPSEDTPIKCYGMAGTDVASADNNTLDCTVDYKKRYINITNAVSFQRGNPGAIRILISKLRNPVENIITESFHIETETADGWVLDSISQNVTVNFYCQFPCASCEQDFPDVCQSCYASALEKFFFEDACYMVCPDGYVDNESNNCTLCEEPCATCEGAPELCTSCIEGYKLVDGEFYCREIVLWPFPYLIFGFISFIVIGISEIATKGVSRFKEAYIAALAIPEFLSWITLLVFMWYRVGSSGSTALCMIAILLYIMINIAHAIIHPRQMHPNSLPTYKELYVNYPAGTCVARFLSYIISFKFSLLLVSWFCMNPRFKGDYSAMNWKQFNRFSMAFIFLCYPIQLLACIWFLYFNGMFSYPGFVAIEVMLISSLLVFLMVFDALSSIKCKTVGKKNSKGVFKVATGADYESDDDIVTKGVLRKGNKDRRIRVKSGFPGESSDGVDDSDDFDNSKRGLTGGKGRTHMDADELDKMSRFSNDTGILGTNEARKQIQMLEELAKQMRLEKQQIEREKQLLEEQRRELESQREAQEYRLDSYLKDQQRQTSALSDQVRQLERQKIDLVSRVEDKLAYGADQSAMLVKQIETEAGRKQRRNYRDIEGEMEDYEPVAEENSIDEDSDHGDVVDTFIDRMESKPAFGEIDYYRQMEGEDQQWMQLITPRAGGDSMLGQHDQEDEGQLNMDKNRTAQYADDITMPPTRCDNLLEVGVEDAVYQDDSAEMIDQNSEEFQNRSDAVISRLSDRANNQASQEFFENERAVFSRQKKVFEKESAQEMFNAIEEPVFEKLGDHIEKHGTEQKFFNQLLIAEKGEGEDPNEKRTEEQKFFNQERPTFEEVIRDDENTLEKTGTQQKFFTNEKPMMEITDDVNRSGVATPIQAFAMDSAAYSQVPDNDGVSGVDQRQFMNKTPVNEDISDIRSKLASEMVYQEREQALVSQGDDMRDKSGSQMQFFQNEDGKYSQDRSAISKGGYNQEFFKNDEAVRGDVSSQDRSANISQHFINKANKSQEDDYGRASDYTRQRDAIHEYAGTPEKDESGVSESSEGSIANHGLFNAKAPHGRTGQKPRATSPHFHEDQRADGAPDQAAEQMPGRKSGKPPRQILYSDKSETSVEELMDDTPSNYNIQNGRFEGKSLGLKALLLHAKSNKNQTLDVINERDRSPEAMRAKAGSMVSSGMVAAQRGIIGSQNDEKNFINNLYSGQDGSAAGTQQNTRKNVRTNKQFANEQSSPVRVGQSRSPRMAANQKKGATLKKNNFVNK